MTITAEPDSAAASPPEQSGNRLQTGYSLSQLAEFIGNTSQGWKETDHVPVKLLRALCRLVTRLPDQAMDGYTAQDLVIEMRQERPQWPEVVDKTDASRKINKYWSTLIGLLGNKSEHLAEELRKQGFEVTAGLAKDQGGGQGLVSRYRLYPVPMPDQGQGPLSTQATGIAMRPLADDEVVYAPVDSATLTGLSARLTTGIEMSGWTRLVFLAFAMLCIVSIVLAGLALVALALSGRTLLELLSALVAIGLPVAAIYSIVLPPVRVLTERILKAPFWLQGGDDLWLLEWRCPPLHTRKSIHRVRYSSTCPLCGGRVDVDIRSWRLPANQLIGRCENAPAAHQYSFDHVTRRGRRL